MNKKFRSWLTLVLLGASWGTGHATTFLELQSSYLGDGWFQYRMSVLNDPFFTQSDVPGVQVGFTNQIDQSTTAANWVNTDSTNGYSSWAFSSGNSPAAPFEVNWLVRSSETTYRLQTNFFSGDAMAQLSLNIASIYPGISQGGGVFSANAIGCVNLPCLAPCPPDQADGSPTNYVFDLKLSPEVTIKQLIQTNGQIQGVDFPWDAAATFILQGTGDLKNWTNIAYIWSDPPETTWTTNANLNGYGSYFRLELVTDGHSTNLAPLVSNAGVKPQAPLPVKPTTILSCRLTGGNIAVAVSSNPGQSFYLQALDSGLVVRQSQYVIPGGSSTTVNFSPASLPNPVYFRALVQ